MFDDVQPFNRLMLARVIQMPALKYGKMLSRRGKKSHAKSSVRQTLSRLPLNHVDHEHEHEQKANFVTTNLRVVEEVAHVPVFINSYMKIDASNGNVSMSCGITDLS